MYGPYRINDTLCKSIETFDLKKSNLGNLENFQTITQTNNLMLAEIIEMPANNQTYSLLWKRI